MENNTKTTSDSAVVVDGIVMQNLVERPLLNIEKIKYCDKKSSNTGSCSNIATRQTKMTNPKYPTKIIYGYRCEEHAHAKTVAYKVIESLPLDQSYKLQKIKDFLKKLIGKKIYSKYHRRILVGQYLKENGAIMCKTENTNKYKLVYYHQVSQIIA